MTKKEKHAEVNVTPTSVKTNNMFNYVFYYINTISILIYTINKEVTRFYAIL